MFDPLPSPDDLARLMSRLGDAATAVPDLELALRLRSVRAVTRGEACAVVTPGPWRAVLAAVGPPPALLALILELREQSDALVWDEPVVPLEADALSRLGLRRVVREAFVQDLTRLPPWQPRDEAVQFSRCEGELRAGARDIFVATHAHTLEGLYTTVPQEPTPEACARAFSRAFSGQVIEASAIVAHQGPTVLGVVYCTREPETDEPLLMGLGVAPAARGQGLSWGLVRRTQHALLAAGHQRMHFLTTDRNLPVHKLFTPDEIVKSEAMPIWFGMRERATRRWA